MLQAQTLKNTLNVTSSPESVVGPKPSDLQDGQQLDLFGLDLVLASHFPAQVNDKGQKTNGTCGRSSTGSSESANLTLSLGNRLKERLGLGGSMEYLQTWKLKTTPAGRQYWAHIASTRRTSDKDYTGWPTPQEDNANNARGHKGTCYSDLPTTAQMAGWGTPNCMDHLPSKNLEERKKKGGCCNLKDQVTLISGPTQSSSHAETEKPAGLVLNPNHSRWLMGYREEWDYCGATAMQSSRKSRRSS